MKVSLKDRHGCAECPIRAAIDKPGCSAEDAEHRLQMFCRSRVARNPRQSIARPYRESCLKGPEGPVSLVSLIAEDRQVFVAQLGFARPGVNRAKRRFRIPFASMWSPQTRFSGLKMPAGSLPEIERGHQGSGCRGLSWRPAAVGLRGYSRALCLIEPHPRVWTDDDEALLQDYARWSCRKSNCAGSPGSKCRRARRFRRKRPSSSSP